MGCCSSQPVESDGAQHGSTAPQPRRLPDTTTSQTAINPTAQGRNAQQLEPPSATSLRHSDASGLSASHRSSLNDGRPRQVDLSEHYNLPLQAPKSWTSKEKVWTKSQLKRERYEFFETRVTGRSEIWEALKQVAESIRDRDLVTAQGILDAVGVTLPTGRLEEGGYDEAGNLYKLPKPILSDPTNVSDEDGGDEQTVVGIAEAKDKFVEDDVKSDTTIEQSRDDKGKAVVDKDAVKVVCRLSDRGGPDVIVLLGQSQTVGTLVQRVRAEGEVQASARIRIAYLGRILDDKQTLSAQGWKEGHILNALVSGAFAS